MTEPGTRNPRMVFFGTNDRSLPHERLQPQGGRYVRTCEQVLAEATERLEKETAELIKYLNDEVVPAVRQHSTKGLRVASEKLSRLADYLDESKRK